MPVKKLSSSRSPLYVQVSETLRQRIDRGRWKEGDLLPTLDALAAEFGVGKITVRQAMRILQDEGLVVSRRGRGTTVMPQETAARPLNVETSLAALVNMYRGDKPDLTNLDEGQTTLPENFEMGEPFDCYQMIKRTHSRNGNPYCVITLYIASPIFDRHKLRFRNEIALPILFEDTTLSIKKARQSMSISKCDLETANVLNLPIGEPMADVRRIMCDSDDRIIYLADVVYRGDFIQLDMDLLAK